MKVLVTGANGFLGSSVVEQLLKNRVDVRVLVRTKKSIEGYFWKDRVEIFEADLRFHQGLKEAFAKTDALVHLAACKSGDEEAQFDSTVVGTENLLGAMQKSNVKRLILVSSISVYDYHKISKVLNEECPLESNLYQRDGYAISKVWQERVAVKASQKFGWDLTILRPGMIWGKPREYPLVLSIPLGPLHFIIGPMKHSNLVHVESCAKAVVQTLNNGSSIGEAINIIDEEKISAWKFMGKYLKTTKAKNIRVPVPFWLAFGIVNTVYAMSRCILGKSCKLPSVFIPSRFEARFKPFVCYQEKLKQLQQGSDPKTSYEELFKKITSDAKHG